MGSRWFLPIFLSVLLMAMLSSCGAVSQGDGSKSPAGAAGNLQVVTTTTLVGDVVKNIGGEHIQLHGLIPAGVDEHAFEPNPQDIAQVGQADLVFMNGAGLEQFTNRLIENAGSNAKLIAVSDGITLKESTAHVDEPVAQGTASGDPHVWMDPNNVLVWVDNIEKALAEADPQHMADYQKNAEQYRQQLKELDAWIAQQVEKVPTGKRKLVTDHTIFTYFASRYSFDQVGAVVPGYSSVSEPSAQELAALEDNIRKLGVPVIFVGNTVNPALSERVAEDTDTRLVQILTGSLTAADGPAPTYLEYMRFNVNAIVSTLGQAK